MAQQTLNNGISGSAFRTILNDNFTDLYTNKAQKSHASSTTEFGAASTSNFGHVKIESNSGLSVSSGVLSANIATKAQAEAGSINTALMTPGRVKEAIAYYGVMSDGNVIVKIGSTQPST